MGNGLKGIGGRPLMQTNGNCGEHSLGVPMPIDDIAQFLFALLDDIDTAEDIAKGDDAMFRGLARSAFLKRFKVATTDGYGVTFNTHKETP
tara:strand:+ start:1722 stop:1994 length:273 start_codon:yes stop_codon:yes gene_type:complete